jgi:O-antigen/teichoic acid export membrane protein
VHTTSRIIINVLTNWVSVGIQALIGLLLVPFLLRHLGKEAYGLTTLVGVIIGFTVLADLGLRLALGRQLTEQVAKKDFKRYNELACTGLLLFVSIGLICVSVCVMLAPMLVNFFKLSPALRSEAIFLIRWYGSASILLSFTAPVFGAIITSMNRFDLVNIRQIGFSILTGIAYFLVLGLTGTGIFGWAVVSLVSSVCSCLILLVMARRVFPPLDLRLRHFRPEAVGSLFSIGGYMYALQLTNVLSVQANPLIITSFFGPSGVALFTPGGSLPTQVRPLVTALVDQLHPVTTAYYVTGHLKELQDLLIRGTKYTVLISIPVCVVLAVFAIPFMRLWLEPSLGSDYRIPAFVMMCWAVADLFNYASGTQWPVLLGTKRLKFWVWTQIPAGILNIALAFFLVAYTRLGIVGVMVATVLICILRRPILIVHTAHVCGMSAWRYFTEAYGRPLGVLLLVGLAATVIHFTFRPTTWFQLLGCVGGVGILWIPLSWWGGFDREDRQTTMRILGKALNKFRDRV